MTKPDFIIIGAMKCATSTLHAQLANQSGIFMTEPKEPNYFSDDEQYALGDRWYENLFRDAKTTDLCGESSTHYTKFPHYPLTIERMMGRLKSPKFIYVMRHPIERTISHYMHQWSQGEISCDINQALDDYEELTAYSRYANQLKPYIEQFGHESILLVFNESLRLDPQKQLERIANFIGHSSPVVWHDTIKSQNISSERIRKFKGYSLLIESRVMKCLRRALISKSLRNKIKARFTMDERPVVDKAHHQLLTKIFDEDLKELGMMLGVELSCDKYNNVISDPTTLDWSTQYFNR